MFRTITPKKQAKLVEDFINRHPAGAVHSEVLELVAALNGAPHWNALVAQTGKERESALAKAVKSLLRPLAQSRQLSALLDACRPGSKSPAGRGLVEGLYAWLAEPTASLSESPLPLLRDRLMELNSVTDGLLKSVNQSLGACLEGSAPDDWVLMVLSTRLFDESEGFSIDWEGNLLPLFDEADEARNEQGEAILERIAAHGTVREATIEYPRGDRYGVPEEATESGCREWLWGMGFKVDTRFDAYGCDRGDDGMASVELVLSVPPSLHQEVIEMLTAFAG